jgi:hypothetical protein
MLKTLATAKRSFDAPMKTVRVPFGGSSLTIRRRGLSLRCSIQYSPADVATTSACGEALAASMSPTEYVRERSTNCTAEIQPSRCFS